MKKESEYARKRRLKSAPVKNSPAQVKKRAAMAWAAALERSMSYGAVNSEAGQVLIAIVDSALKRILAGDVSEQSCQEHDELMHAIGTALVRAEQIEGETQAALETLTAGAKVLNYCSTHWKLRGAWPVPDPAQNEALAQAVEVYKDILWASSPLQMERAWRVHLQSVQKTMEGVQARTV